MGDIRWHDVREWFNPYGNGSLPDVIVHGTTLADWEALFGLIQSNGWRCEYDFRGQRLPLPASAADLFVPDPEREARALRVWPAPGMEWIVRPWSPDEIDSDVNLHEIQGQGRLDAFCEFLRMLGKALGKRVLVYAEGTYDGHAPMLAYEVANDRVVFLAGA